MRVIFVCGGTAGHINPALAVAAEVRRIDPDAKILFVGSGRQLENRLIPQEGYRLTNIAVRGFDRRLSPAMVAGNLRALKALRQAFSESEKILQSFAPDVVVGTGGYVCYPVLAKAADMGIPTFIHESNAVLGLATKMLAGKVDNILVAFESIPALRRYADKTVYVGTPVRGDFGRLTKHDARLKLGIDGRPLVVSFWGSLGAEHMNEMILDFIEMNARSRLFNHIHATGGGEAVHKALKDKLAGRRVTSPLPQWIDIRPYIANMAEVMAAADLILCRAGASTIAELTYLGKPALIVPSPNVANNHQLKNARRLEAVGGAAVLEEKDLTGEKLYETVRRLLIDLPGLARMSQAMKSLGVSDSAKRIAELIFSAC
jgi:UDP-N-acetylglucosamine--N-acetylmuramyl-(pentapeptide) pyrophosphoryl-undecaprenol N-acetylglucosamine transferase